MSGHLPKDPSEFHKIPTARLAIIASMWHPDCVDAMITRAQAELIALGVKKENIAVHKAPGSLELPFVAQVLFENDKSLDAILAFGVVLKGETTHNDAVIQQVVEGFGRVSAHYFRPIINEVIGVNSLDDAKARSGSDDSNKGLEAVFAVSELLNWSRSFEKTSTVGF